MTSPILTELTHLFSNTSTVPYADATRWMRSSENVEVVQSFLGASDRKETRNFLAYMLMHKEASDMFDEEDNPLDAVLKRLVDGLYQRVTGNEPAEAILAASKRVLPVFDAWKKRDKNVLLTYLSDRAVKAMMADDEDGMTSEMLCKWIEQIGGDEVAARTRQRCSRQWTRATREQLPSIIQETMERAYWDHVKQAIAEQDLAPLFDVLGQVQQAVKALLSAAPTTRGDFEDRFDVAWIKTGPKTMFCPEPTSAAWCTTWSPSSGPSKHRQTMRWSARGSRPARTRPSKALPWPSTCPPWWTWCERASFTSDACFSGFRHCLAAHRAARRSRRPGPTPPGRAV